MKRERLSDTKQEPRETLRVLDPPPKPFVRLMLDSGAYSAWFHDESIDIDEYIKYIKKYRHLIDTYVNLDVIPGTRGQPNTTAEVEKSAQASYDNLQYMKSKGLSPIPVFHQGERFAWLLKLLDDGEPYIGVSPSDDLSNSARGKWMDQVFTLLTDRRGKPICQTHGFGVTGIPFMFRYPWTTVDSTSWSLIGSYGRVLVPQYVSGKPVYDRMPTAVVVSGLSSKIKGGNKLAYAMMGPTEQACVRRFLEEEVGITLQEARYDDDARRRAVAIYFRKLSECRGEVFFKHRIRGFGR